MYIQLVNSSQSECPQYFGKSSSTLQYICLWNDTLQFPNIIEFQFFQEKVEDHYKTSLNTFKLFLSSANTKLKLSTIVVLAFLAFVNFTLYYLRSMPGFCKPTLRIITHAFLLEVSNTHSVHTVMNFGWQPELKVGITYWNRFKVVPTGHSN